MSLMTETRIPLFDVLDPAIATGTVRVYRNLHVNMPDGRPAYSVQDARTRLVIAHAATIYLTDVVFRVSETGRQRVLREKRKNVHAFVTGRPTDLGLATQDAYYNPYEVSQFVDRATREPLTRASFAVVDATGVHYTP